MLGESIAHVREEDDAIQTVEEHLLDVKDLAESYGDKIGVKYIAGLAGLLHDLGKYSNEFVSYIKAAVYDPDNAPPRGSVDHSTAGGKLLYDLFHKDNKNKLSKLLCEIVGNAIISHHSYLHDYLTPDLNTPFLTRVQKELPQFNHVKTLFFKRVISEDSFFQYVKEAESELKAFLQEIKQDNIKFYITLLTKFIFSCLIDADRTNTRQFVESDLSSTSINQSESKQLFKCYLTNLHEKLNELTQSKQSNSPINKLRAKMSEQCAAFASRQSGIYTLSIPTGGGKTLASFRYALKHALKFNKKRIIYVVPYTTIIEQNADEIRKIIKDDKNLLEHHSNIVIDDNDIDSIYGSEVDKKLSLAKDNWDVPIIFTTLVQYLDVFYQKGTRNIRRLHNLSESIVIFDEVQKVPTHCISLFNQSLNFLSEKAKTSIILCTATQPALEYVEHQLEVKSDAEIVEDLNKVNQSFKRVNIVDKATMTTYTNNDLLQFCFKEIEVKDSLLIILNTKSVVRDLYKKLSEEGLIDVNIYHLSTSMCAAHRMNILDDVRSDLKNNKKVICVSTQLIEAGVDISFDCVIRSLAGLDSIAQAAGRCNRHGEENIREVYVIDHAEEYLNRLQEIATGKKITRKILVDLQKDETAHGGAILSPEAMDRYFQEYYKAFNIDLDYLIAPLGKSMIDLLSKPKHLNEYYHSYLTNTGKEYELMLTNSYRTAADYFQVIDNVTTPILVPYEKGKELIAELNSYAEIEDISKVFREIQHYSVGVYENELNELNKNGQLQPLMDGKILTVLEGAYSVEYGLETSGTSELGLHLH